MSEVIYKRCPTCGTVMERDESKVLTSLPAQYQYFCPACGQMEYDTYIPSRGASFGTLDTDAPCEKAKDSQEWKEFRKEVAKDTLRSMIAAYTVDNANIFPDPEEVCGMAVLYADELIKQLIKEEECQGQSDQ